MGTQWAGMGRSLMQLPDFRESILRSDAALKDTGLVVSRLLMDADDATFEDTVHAFVGLAAIQVVWRGLDVGTLANWCHFDMNYR